MKCDDCKFANWYRTSNGRLHPNKAGRCTFSKKVYLPISASYSLMREADLEGAISIKGGTIWRGEDRNFCAYYGRVSK